MTTKNKIVVAKIICPFGVKGEVKIINYFQNFSDIEIYPLFDENNNKITVEITNKNKLPIGFDINKNPIFIAKINNYSNKNDILFLKGRKLMVERSNLPKNAEDEFYLEDLKNLSVIFDQKNIGIVVNVSDFGGGVLLDLKFEPEFLKEYKLSQVESVPFKNKFFPNVNIENSTIDFDVSQFIIANQE